MPITSVSNNTISPGSLTGPDLTSQPAENKAPANNGPAAPPSAATGRIPLGKGGVGASEAARRSMLLRTQSAMRAKQLNDTTRATLKAALETPGLTDMQKFEIEHQLERMDLTAEKLKPILSNPRIGEETRANFRKDIEEMERIEKSTDPHLKAIKDAQAAQSVLDDIHYLGLGAEQPHRVPALKPMADKLGESITEHISLAMKVPASERQHGPRDIDRYPESRNKEIDADIRNSMTGRLLLYKEKLGPELSEEQKTKIDHHLRQLQRSDLSDLERADTDNFVRNMGVQFNEHIDARLASGNSASNKLEEVYKFLMTLLGDEEEEKKRKGGSEPTQAAQFPSQAVASPAA